MTDTRSQSSASIVERARDMCANTRPISPDLVGELISEIERLQTALGGSAEDYDRIAAITGCSVLDKHLIKRAAKALQDLAEGYAARGDFLTEAQSDVHKLRYALWGVVKAYAAGDRDRLAMMVAKARDLLQG